MLYVRNGYDIRDFLYSNFKCLKKIKQKIFCIFLAYLDDEKLFIFFSKFFLVSLDFLVPFDSRKSMKKIFASSRHVRKIQKKKFHVFKALFPFWNCHIRTYKVVDIIIFKDSEVIGQIKLINPFKGKSYKECLWVKNPNFIL